MNKILFPIVGYATTILLLSCKTTYVPVETFRESENPIAMTDKQKSEWKNLDSGLKASWTDPGIHHSISDVPVDIKMDTCRIVGWRGEKVSAEILLWSSDSVYGIEGTVSEFCNIGDSDSTTLFSLKSGRKTKRHNVLPSSIAELDFVRYTLSDSTRQVGGQLALMPDMIDSLRVFDMEPGKVRPMWMSVKIPSDAVPGIYSASVTVKSSKGGNFTLPLQLEVQNHTLPSPHNWKYHLDLWQHPSAVARAQGMEVWSDEHFEALKPIMKRLAQAGQKVVTATLNKDPWNHQCYDGYEPMIKWSKNVDGTWYYDYDVFDKWVGMMQGLGINKMINCYSMVPWNCEIEYFDKSADTIVTMRAEPGSDAFEEIWAPFLKDFKSHLQKRGWLGITNIAMDERSPEEMDAAVDILMKYAPEMGFALADNHSSYKKYTSMRDVCVAQGQRTDHEDILNRRDDNYTTTFYVCCGPAFPNTFTSSEPFEAELLAWYGLAWDYDGMLRWAYNSWPENPQADSRYGVWTSGDTFIVYPYNRSSLRFESLIAGIESVEKVRLLREKGIDTNDIESILEQIRTSDINDSSLPWREIVLNAKKALDKVSRLPIP